MDRDLGFWCFVAVVAAFVALETAFVLSDLLPKALRANRLQATLGSVVVAATRDGAKLWWCLNVMHSPGPIAR